MARWTFDNLVPGEYYQIAVTHQPDPSHGRPRYTVYVDGVQVSVFSGNQITSSFDFFDAGVGWTVLDILPVATSTIVFEIDSSSTNNDPHVVDAARVQAVEGRRGADDDFHLQSSSPAIDAGDPNSPFLSEPAPNGGRVNIGGYGNTFEATNSPDPLIQVLSPNGLEIVEAGQLVPVTWRSAGLTLDQTIARINVGTLFQGGTVGDWIKDDYVTHDSYSTLDNFISQAIDVSGVVNPAPEEVYQYNLLSNRSTGRSFSYSLPVEAGDYTVRLHFVDSTTAAGQRLFDIRLQDQLVFASYDIFAAAGARYKAVTESFNVTVNGSEGIFLEMVAVDGHARLSGLEVTRVNPNGTANPVVDLEYTVDSGNTWNLIASGVSLDSGGSGSYDWVAGPETIGNTALIRVTHGTEGMPDFAQDVSDDGFTITSGGNHYYVNDGSTVGDVFTTAVGDDLNDGKDPGRPKATITNVLSNYDLGPGDIIHVDTGTYTLVGNIVITDEDSGVTIEGPSSAVALIDRNSGGTDVGAFEINGANNVTIDHLSITGGLYGILTTGTEGNDFITVSNNHVFGSIFTTAIRLTGSADDAVISGNLVENTFSFTSPNSNGIHATGLRTLITGNAVSGWGDGIEASLTSFQVPIEDRMIVSNNFARTNTIGIHGRGRVLITGNITSGNDGNFDSEGIGIFTDFGSAQVIGNTSFGNRIGISGDGRLFEDNTVFDNYRFGIDSSQFGTWRGNHVYDNNIGIRVEGFSNTSEFTNNLVYDNEVHAFIVDAFGSTIINNTIHHVGASGEAVRLEFGAHETNLRNNIIVVDSGYAITVDDDSQEDLQSDYNLFHLTGSAKLALWGADEITTLKDWHFEVGQGFHSQFADPLLINPAGPDSVLGYSTASDGAAQIIDNSSPSGFTTTGIWSVQAGGYNGTYLEKTSADPSASATWTFTGLTPGQYYTVAATWDSSFSRSSARYFVRDQEGVALEVLIDQRDAPDDFSASGAIWENLGVVRMPGTTLIVTFDSAGTLSADAIRLQQVQGDRGVDDDFHASTISPAVDQGDPFTYFLGEPSPNGARVNLGAYGNTIESAVSPTQTIQVISPNGWEKYEEDQTVSLEWLNSGFLLNELVGLMNLGGETVGNWLANKYEVEFSILDSSEFTVDSTGVNNPAPDDVYRQYIRVFNSDPRVYQIPLPDGTYDIRLHVVGNTTIAGMQLLDVAFENQNVLDDFDVFTLAPNIGVAAALDLSATVTGGDGLRIDFTHDIANYSADVAAIEIFRTNPNGFVVSSADLEISTDMGVTWASVASNVLMDRFGRGSFDWTAGPQTNGNEALFRVTSVQNPARVDQQGESFLGRKWLIGKKIKKELDKPEGISHTKMV